MKIGIKQDNEYPPLLTTPENVENHIMLKKYKSSKNIFSVKKFLPTQILCGCQKILEIDDMICYKLEQARVELIYWFT